MVDFRQALIKLFPSHVRNPSPLRSPTHLTKTQAGVWISVGADMD